MTWKKCIELPKCKKAVTHKNCKYSANKYYNVLRSDLKCLKDTKKIK